MTVTILQGDALEVLKSMDAESVDCVVTSPPYWGLRDYGVPPKVWGGDLECDHVWGPAQRTAWANGVPGPNGAVKNPPASRNRPKETGPFCLHCGAWNGCLGLEPTLGMHIDIMVSVFAEVHRVLKKTGTCWVNYGDCYATAKNGRSAADTKKLSAEDRTFRDKPFSTIGGTLKPRDLCLMPHRFAIAMQEFGWWVRSDITWGKPNAMPDSSGRYRPSTASERIFMFHKETPYYDAEAVKMPPAPGSAARAERGNTGTHAPGQPPHRGIAGPREAKQKMPDNWDTGAGAHGSFHREGREKGKTYRQRGHSRRHAVFNDRWDKMTKAEQQEHGRLLRNYEPDLTPICGQEVWEIPAASFSEAHFATFPPALVMPCIMAGCPEGGIVLDPFGGAGTTGLVADRLGRDCILIEMNPGYIEIAERRIKGDCPMFTEVA